MSGQAAEDTGGKNSNQFRVLSLINSSFISVCWPEGAGEDFWLFSFELPTVTASSKLWVYKKIKHQVLGL